MQANLLSLLSNAAKAVLFIFLLIVSSVGLQAQTDVKIGTNPGNKTSSAVLELESTSKGFLLPRMTAAQMNAISSPANGLSIYNTDDSCVYVRRNTVWRSTCDPSALGAWSLLGNASTNPAINYLGTTDAQDLVFKTNAATRFTITSTGALTQTGTGLVTFTGLTNATNGLNVTNALLTANAGSTLTGATNVNATGAGATNIGNASSATTVLGATTINTTGTAATSIGNSGSTVTVAGTTGITGATSINTSGALGTTIGNASSATTVTGATAINTTGVLGTSIGNASSTTTVVGATNINTSGAATTTIGNASATTTIVAPNLNITGLNGGATTDSLVSVNNATGAVRKLKISDVLAAGFTADNGLTKTGTNVQLGGTLLQATSIAQAGFDLKMSGGNVAIGSATAPTSTLQLTGSLGVSYRKVTANTTLASTDYVVLANATSGAFTLTLPTASTCTGRTYYIGKSDETTNAVTFSPVIYLTETTTISSINFAKKYRIISDGSNWVIYNE